MLGRDITLPIDLMFPAANGPRAYTCTIDYVEWVRQALQECFKTARENLNHSASRQRHYYDKRAEIRKFKTGDWVLRFYPPGLSRSKLNPHFVGPYLVLKKREKPHISFNGMREKLR